MKRFGRFFLLLAAACVVSIAGACASSSSSSASAADDDDDATPVSDDDDDNDASPNDDDDDDNPPAALTIKPAFPPTAAPGRMYGYQFVAEGGRPPYKDWRVVHGHLPPDMTLDADTGVLSGTARQEERLYYFIVQAGDSSSPPQRALETFGLRVGDVSRPGPLLQKARYYAEIYLARHNMDGLTVTADQPDDPNGDYWFSDLGDAAFIHGNTSASAAFRYAVEPSDETLQYAQLHARGLRMLSDVIGIPGLLGRSYAPADAPFNPEQFQQFYPQTTNWHGVGQYSNYYWGGNVSIDQYSGAIVGMSLLYDLVPDDSVRGVMRKSITDVADYLWAHGLRVYDPDGTPTTYGDFRATWIDGFPMFNGVSAAACLAWFKLAHYVSGDAKYEEIYETLAYDQAYAWILQRFM